jgi:hypothetical protein
MLCYTSVSPSTESWTKPKCGNICMCLYVEPPANSNPNLPSLTVIMGRRWGQIFPTSMILCEAARRRKDFVRYICRAKSPNFGGKIHCLYPSRLVDQPENSRDPRNPRGHNKHRRIDAKLTPSSQQMPRIRAYSRAANTTNVARGVALNQQTGTSTAPCDH